MDGLRQPDVERPNIARVYDYMLGGNHNFAADREFAQRVQERLPGIVSMYASNRAFLRRVVRFCIREGVDQFLDLGSGIPTMGPVHEVARSLDPTARVVYVDHDPIAVAHGEQILSGTDGVEIVGADLRDPAAVLAEPRVRAVLDLDRPVAVLLVAVLHFVAPREDPAGLVAAYCAALVPGSRVAISHGSADLREAADRATMLEGERLYRESSSPIHLRDRREIGSLLGRVPPAEPGVVELRDWRPDPEEPSGFGVCGGYGLVGRVDATNGRRPDPG